jgi:hypothetical protein
MKDKRTKSIKIRLFESELAELHEKKIGGELATWMRETCLGKKSKRRTAPLPVDPVLLRKLSSLGNNINQIARQCNSNLQPSDAIEVFVRLDAIQSVIEKMRNDHAS